MTDTERRLAARQFARDWAGRGDEKQETQAFWLALLQKVCGVDEPEKFVRFELPVKLSHTSFIDAYIDETRVLIEQKSWDIDLAKGQKQSDGSVLTPYQQARRYAGYLPHNRNPRWIVVCNFREFQIYDMNRPNDPPERLALADLEKEYPRLRFLTDTGSEQIKREMEISLQAGELVGVLYDALLKQYKAPEAPETLKSLNKLCVRLVFCLYAEDAGIFGAKNLFHDYLAQYEAKQLRKALRDLFRVLDQKPEERDPYLADDDPLLAAFPYVNGGLFSDEAIEIPPFTDELRTVLMQKASAGFDWSEISPTIFGAVFESTLNPETRRSGGMHYTSIENIHKVIDPLFLTALREEYEAIAAVPVLRTRDARLRAFQDKLAGLTFLDPACGSGNFLTETYLSLRRLENRVIEGLIACEKGQQEGQIMWGDKVVNPIKVSIGQFYGIEINDFAVTVAKTALWIAESQMLRETEAIVRCELDFLPLRSYANIVEANALRIDWETVVPKAKLDYIMGNPPFVSQGGSSDRGQRQEGAGRDASQAEDMSIVFGNEQGTGNLDYVACWFRKAADLIHHSKIVAAFVSTNSICQGQQVFPLWKKLFDNGIHIAFAYQSFLWRSEATDSAFVYCVIIGFCAYEPSKRTIFSSSNYSGSPSPKAASNINPYLIDAPNVFISSRSKPIDKATSIMVRGGGSSDWGYLTLSEEERNELLAVEPKCAKWIRPYLQGYEFLNNVPRYCLWMVGISPNELKAMPAIMDRIYHVKEKRLNSKKASTRKKAETPWLFDEIITINADHYIAVPQVSSGNRRYIPIGYVSANTIAGNKLLMIPGATLYDFGILCSNVHNAWIRVVASKFGPSYQYSANIAYNNFPWPNPTEAQRAKIEQTAQAILDARALYPDCSLADLYDEATMPPELRRAHQANDRAVMQAYGFDIKSTTEPTCVAELMKRYQQLTAQ